MGVGLHLPGIGTSCDGTQRLGFGVPLPGGRWSPIPDDTPVTSPDSGQVTPVGENSDSVDGDVTSGGLVEGPVES